MNEEILKAEIALPEYASLDDVAAWAKGSERVIDGWRVVPIIEIERKLFELDIYEPLDDARGGGAEWTAAQRRAAKTFWGALAAFPNGFDFRVPEYRAMIGAYLDRCVAATGLMTAEHKAALTNLGKAKISRWEQLGIPDVTTGDISRARPHTINGIVFETRDEAGKLTALTIRHDDGTTETRTPGEHQAATAGA